MKVIGIIPARLNSTRLPNKPLIDINGKPMIQHVYERAIESKLNNVIVACDNLEVYNEVISFGGVAVMTSKNHLNGSTRIAEALKNIETDFVINIQGDEPLITAELINQLVDEIKSDTDVITLKHEIIDDYEIDNPNNVKVITNKFDNAMYFSRSRIPYNRKENTKYYKHIGLYVYSKKFLLNYVKMAPTNLEETESLEQLRILENGYSIKVIETNQVLIGVDTIEDLITVRKMMK